MARAIVTSKSAAEICTEFWYAPDDALFPQSDIAAVTTYSKSWLERARWAGGGIPYLKVGRKVLYRKRDVVEWLNQQARATSTSEYVSGVR